MNSQKDEGKKFYYLQFAVPWTVKIAQNFLIQLAQILEIIISQNLWTLLSHLNFGFHSQKNHHKKTFLVKTGQKIISISK